MQMLVELFLVFFKIGAVTFGGGYAMLPILQKEVVAVSYTHLDVYKRQEMFSSENRHLIFPTGSLWERAEKG